MTDLNLQITALKAEVISLKLQIDEERLDQAAARTHLRDYAEKVRAKATNLLKEDVLVPISLAFLALSRDNPKINVAAHQIELAGDAIDQSLEWLRK